MNETEKLNISCAACGKTLEVNAAKSGQPKIPHGWKRLHGAIYCKQCKTQHAILRAVSIPVATCDWKSLRLVLWRAWRETAACANWLVSQYYSRDPLVGNLDEKLPKFILPYLYPEAKALFPNLEPTALTAIINDVQGKYRAMRFDLWRHRSSLPTFRDMPLPLNPRAWRLVQREGRWIFEFRFLRKWHSLILRGGGQFYRQHAMLRQLLSGEAEAGQAAVYQRGDVWLLKIIGWFPKSDRKGSGIVYARTAPDCFLIAVKSERIWRLNADHVRGWLLRATQQQQRLREDWKAERRSSKRARAGLINKMFRVAEKRSARLDSWLHESSHQLVAWAARQNAAKLVWSEEGQTMLPDFPWFRFRQQLANKCAVANIDFENVTPEARPSGA